MVSCCRVFLFIVIFVLEIVDLILDWDFYVEVSKIDFIGDNIKYSILGFVIFGIFLFLFIVFIKCFGICNSDDDD